jgi:predicted lipid-binding transport protein (Tim44 family)
LNRQAVPPSAVQQAMPQRSGWMSGLMGGVTGLVLGGLIGSTLFGGLSGGLFGSLGLLEILLIGGLIYFAFVYMRRRQQPVPASPYGYGPPQGVNMPSWQSKSRSASTVPMGVTESDLERGKFVSWITPLILTASLRRQPRRFAPSRRRGQRATWRQHVI